MIVVNKTFVRSCDKQIGVGLEDQTKTVVSEITIFLTATAILRYMEDEKGGRGRRDRRDGRDGRDRRDGREGATFPTSPLILQ